MHTRKLVTLTIVAALGVATVQAASSDRASQTGTAGSKDPASIASIAAQLESAALAGYGAGVKDARLACLRLLAAPMPADRTSLARYTVAYADWRLGFMPNLTEKEQNDFLADAKTQLDAVIKAEPRNAEAIGLLSSVYGSQIAHSPDLGMTLGPESGTQLERALSIEPRNPRLIVMKGESQFHTPPEFGGSIRDAEVTFRQALQLFEQEPATKAWPNWGRFDAHAWLGQALADRHDNAGARAEYEQALKIAPDSGWVKYTLLPAVK